MAWERMKLFRKLDGAVKTMPKINDNIPYEYSYANSIRYAVISFALANLCCNSEKPIVCSKSSDSYYFDGTASNHSRKSSPEASHVRSRDSGVPIASSFEAGFVRQSLFDRSDGGHLLTEELEMSDCDGYIPSWNKWNSCLLRKFRGSARWSRDKQFVVKSRRLGDLKEVSRYTPKSLVVGRILDFRFNRFAILDAGNTSVLINDIPAGNTPVVSIKIPKHIFVAAKLLSSTDIITMTHSGKSDSTLRAYIHWIKLDRHYSIKQLASFRYPLDRFDALNTDAFEMWHEYTYVQCTGGNSEACNDLKHSGIRYRKSLKNDKGLTMAVSPSGNKLAAYIFGTLYIFEINERNIQMIRTWKNIFYQTRDHYLEDPSIVWDKSNTRIALASSKRLILVLNDSSGKVHRIIDNTTPRTYDEYYYIARRGIAFETDKENSLIYGNLSGSLSIVDFSTGETKIVDLMRPNRLPKYLHPGMVQSIETGRSEYIIFHDGAVTIVDRDMRILKGRLGSDLCISLSRIISNLRIPYP